MGVRASGATIEGEGTETEIEGVAALAGAMRFVVAASEDERELRSMEVEARRLAGLVRRAEGDAKAEHEAALREHLGKIFDFKLELQNKAIKQAQEEVDERSRALEERTANRNAIIGNRFNELLGRGSSLRW